VLIHGETVVVSDGECSFQIVEGFVGMIGMCGDGPSNIRNQVY
jgi:hypothetical protein